MAGNSATPPFAVQSERAGDVTHVRVSGELDLMTSGALSTALESPEVGSAPQVLVDLGDVTFIDSQGIAALIKASLRSRDAGQDFRLGPLSPQVERTLALAGLLDRFAFADSPGV